MESRKFAPAPYVDSGRTENGEEDYKAALQLAILETSHERFSPMSPDAVIIAGSTVLQTGIRKKCMLKGWTSGILRNSVSSSDSFHIWPFPVENSLL